MIKAWLLVALIFDGGVWRIPSYQPPAEFAVESECEFWAETIERGWQRVDGLRYTVSCDPVWE